MNEPVNHCATSEASLAEPNAGTGAVSLSDRVRSLRLPDPSAAGRSRSARLPWILCLLLAGVSGYLGYFAFIAEPVSRTAEEQQAARLASTSKASEPPAGKLPLVAGGYVIPVRRIQVSPKVGGEVMKLFIVEGKKVHKGDVLAELETVDYRADRDHARAALEEAGQNLLELTQHRQKEIDQAKARWDEAAAQTKQLGLDKRRSTRLRTGGALAERDYEQAECAYLAMVEHEKTLRLDHELLVKGPRDNRIEAAQKRVAQAEADLAKAEWRLENCTVRAPITGTILTKKAEEGNIVNPIAFNISASLCEMADLKALEVDVDVSERDLNQIFLKQKCDIRTEAFPDRVYKGVVARVMPEATRGKASISVRVSIEVPDDDNLLRPEMRARVTFDSKDKDNN